MSRVMETGYSMGPREWRYTVRLTDEEHADWINEAIRQELADLIAEDEPCKP